MDACSPGESYLYLMQKIYWPERIFTGTEWLENHVVIVEGEVIKELRPANQISAPEVTKLRENILAPAYIDLQIYGANKKLLSVFPTPEALHDLYEHNIKGGTILCQPTIATNALEVVHHAIDAVRQYWQQGGKGVIGLHLEGPWISVEKRGAHMKEYIGKPVLEEVEALLEYGKGVISMITLAPEVCSEDVIKLIQSYGIVISAGHSNATYQQAMSALDMGIPAITHLYNAMSPLQHREPGLVGAAFQHPAVRASIIPDGHHVDFAAIAIAKKIMGSRLYVITDAVTETSDGPYPHQLEGDKYVSNGILSGSALTMHQAVMRLMDKATIAFEEAIRMCSLYPAQLMKLDNRYGKIAPGYAAQFLLLHTNRALLNVLNG